MSIQAVDSLVQYGVPQLVSNSAAQKKEVKKLKGPSKNEDYLNSILPPMQHIENGNLWVCYVSQSPGGKVDVMNLQEQLDKRLG